MPDKNNSQNLFLESLSPAAAAQLQPHLHTITLAAGVVLNEPGDEVQYAYFPHTGMISLLAVMHDGAAIETATVGPEGAVGLSAGLGVHITTSRATVQTPLITSRIGATALRSLVRTNEDVRDLIVRFNEILLLQVQMTAACNAVHTLDARLSRWILQTQDRVDTDELPLTHELLSNMLGVRRSSVSEVAAKLQAEKLISYSRGKLIIDDRAGLERSACECYETIKQGAARLLNS